MSRRSPHNAAYEDYTFDGETKQNSDYLGTVSDGVAMFYSHDSNSIFEGEPNDDQKTIRPVEGSEQQLDDGDSLGDVLRSIRDDVGWESLSSFAEEHLGSGDDEDD
ncbi:hypothetical protein [Halorussus halophilus]|uniref:hypothetical protein n=1 Tax=Halorussus halophilus TaxID=2650975 RepID=UPI00130168B0|nr:hypothetical protein [Halorussus halophilus]